MKIFTSQLLNVDTDGSLFSYYFNFIFAFLFFMCGCFLVYLVPDGLINVFNLLINPNVSFSSFEKNELFKVKFVMIFVIPALILVLFAIIQTVHFGCAQIFAQKSHPIYQFIKNKKIANKVYYDAAYLFQSYCQSNKLDNAKLMLNILDDSNSLLLQQLDEQIYNALQEHSNVNDFDLSNFPIYQNLFMTIVSPLEVRKLNDKLTKIEEDFAYVENNLSPKQFLDMIEKLKKMMNVYFTHDEYNDYKQWHLFVHHKIYSVVDKKEPN